MLRPTVTAEAPRRDAVDAVAADIIEDLKANEGERDTSETMVFQVEGTGFEDVIDEGLEILNEEELLTEPLRGGSNRPTHQMTMRLNIDRALLSEVLLYLFEQEQRTRSTNGPSPTLEVTGFFEEAVRQHLKRVRS